MLGLVFGVEVVERAKELVEAVRRGQMVVLVAEVVLAELAGLVAPRLEQLGDRHVAGLETFLRARQPDLEHPGAEADLAGDEGCAAGGAALLPVPVGEERSFPGDPIDVRGLVTHHALVVGADVPVPDVVAPEDEDVRLLRRGLRHRRATGGRHENQHHKRKPAFVSRCVPSFESGCTRGDALSIQRSFPGRVPDGRRVGALLRRHRHLLRHL